MKKIAIIIILTAVAVCTLTCKKFIEPDVYTPIEPSNIPSVEIVEITDITTSSVKLSCEVIKNGGVTIIDRGVCWSTEHEPVFENEHLSAGLGMGAYYCNLTGLEHATKYYVRAYAVNSYGTGYSEEQEVDMLPFMANITTKEVTNISFFEAECGGNVLDDGGGTITARGVCWSTSENPTIDDAHTEDGTGTGEFTSSITGLKLNTQYHVRAYATNENSTNYGNEMTFSTPDGLPTVTTAEISGITSISALCGGNVVDDGGFEVIARGVCWSTSENPTIDDAHTEDGTGTGEFTSSLSGLAATTIYYVRAYATNENGTDYGSEMTFTTLDGSPHVTTAEITDITYNSATCGGNVIDDGNFAVTAKGVCWRTLPNPTIYNDHTTDGSGIGEFTSAITGLNPNTKYYVRAYATNENGTVYGEERAFNTPKSSLFSVSETRKVRFSDANLQYKASTNTWRFAENEYTHIGEANSNISPSYDGWIDLFGWGTGNAPTNSSTNSGDYSVFNDWGNNTIENSGLIVNWRTLTSDEWTYLLKTRQTNSGIRYVKATVVNIPGIIILPDDWDASSYSLSFANTANAAYNTNIISATVWDTKFESQGAVFLSAAGTRLGTNVSNVNLNGIYWSSTSTGSDSRCLEFTNPSLNITSEPPHYGCSVRLVYDAE